MTNFGLLLIYLQVT